MPFNKASRLKPYSIIDITSTKIKYEEGFANVLGHIFTKPEMMWTSADKSLVVPTGIYTDQKSFLLYTQISLLYI